jgi:hypothetical protein
VAVWAESLPETGPEASASGTAQGVLSARCLTPLAAAMALMAAGCEDQLPVRPALAKEAPALAPSACTTQPLAERIAYEHHRVRRYFQPPAGEPELVHRECPDARIRERTAAESERRLVVRMADQRLEPRFLVPLRMTEELESRELRDLSQRLEPSAGGNVSWVGARVPTHLDGPRLLEDLGHLLQRRYLGVYHVTEFRGPDLILKLGDLRRSWLPGIFRAWFVIYDLVDQETLCSFEVQVKSDTRDAPIRSRLRSETRARLEAELGRSATDAARVGLAKVTGALLGPG